MEPTALLRLEPPFLCADHAREHRGAVAIVLLELYRVQLLEVGSRQKAVGNVSCQVIVAALNSFGFIVRRLQLVAGHSDCLPLLAYCLLFTSRFSTSHFSTSRSIPSPPIPCPSLLSMSGCSTTGPARLTLTLTFK